jgi:hypothetical protein
MSELIIDADTRIQILDNIAHLARARKHQYAAFVRSEAVLVVWADHVENVVPAAEALEEALIQFIWRGEEENIKHNQVIVRDAEEAEERSMAGDIASEDMDPEDLEWRNVKRHWKERPVMLWAPITDGISIMLCMGLIALGLSRLCVNELMSGKLIQEWCLDGSFTRFALMIFAPGLFCIASFACMCVTGSIVSEVARHS